MKTYIGIDNGVTGTISILSDDGIEHCPTPIRRELSYTKKKQYITRIDYTELLVLFSNIIDEDGIFCLIERPMINPMRWKASMSAIRALETTLIVLEETDIPYQYIDSKEWQNEFLPSGIVKNKKLKGSKKSHLLKKAAVDIAKRLFPKIKTKDADSLLIAEYAKRKRY